VGLGVFAPVLERVEKLRIEACQAGEVLGVYFVCFACSGVDEPQFAGVGHQHLMATLFE
jgi:hypothetical protein